MILGLVAGRGIKRRWNGAIAREKEEASGRRSRENESVAEGGSVGERENGGSNCGGGTESGPRVARWERGG